MIHSDTEYPYHHDELPRLEILLDNLDWDLLCVFDACRWDVFEELCGPAEPVRSPSRNTPTWTDRVWCNDEYDWSDVTYVSGNPQTTVVRDGEQNGKDWSGVIEDHVGEYVEAWDIDGVWGDYIRTSLPRELSDVAKQYDPPVVVHYTQPHTPFIGDVSLSVNGSFEEFPVVDWDDDWIGAQEYEMINRGAVTPEYVRLAYEKNVELVWDHSEDIRDAFDDVIITADHGEKLGPEQWAHGGPNSPQCRVVPFYTNPEYDPELPSAESIGGSPDHEWLHKNP